MADVLTETRPASSGGGPPEIPEPGFGDYGSGGDAARRRETARMGLWMALGSITMLFSAFTSAYIVRSAGTDWAPLQMLPLLWVNTAVLIFSSVTVEIARRAFNHWRPVAFRKWILITSILGVAFLVGQVLAWGQLAEQGIYLASNPHSSFFYVLTGVHAAHLFVGVGALLYVLAMASRYELTPGESSAPGLVATYWHFVDGLWLYLIVVLFYL